MSKNNVRIETDTFGKLEVPADKYWGAQTQRSLHNFAISFETMPRAMIMALAIIKESAAKVNMEMGIMPADIGNAIIKSAEEVREGKFDDNFPLKIWQTGF